MTYELRNCVFADPIRWPRLLSAIALMLVALTVGVSSASAQEPGRVYRLGWLQIGRPGWVPVPVEQWTEGWAGVRDSLQSAGFIFGKNLILELRHAHGDQSRLPAEAESLIAANVDVIVTVGSPPTIAAMKATKPVPVVFFGVSDPVEKRMIASLSRPGGNATGTTVLITYPKLFQFLHEVSPATRRVAWVSNTVNSRSLGDEREAAYRAFVDKRRIDAATAVGLESFPMSVSNLDEVRSKLTEFASGGNAGIVISVDGIIWNLRTSLMEMAIKNGLASACPQSRGWAEAGCLVTYTEDGIALGKGAGGQVVKILRGAKPADLPVEQPQAFKLIINARTAKALNLTVPPALLHAADEVIE